MTTRADRFHFHIDACAQCRTHPDALCSTGFGLFQQSGIDPVRLQAHLATIRVPPTSTPRTGQCPVRPALDGSQGNPMVWCQGDAGHAGAHSWETPF